MSTPPSPILKAQLTIPNRERQVITLLLRGYDNAEIAKDLDIAERTVKAYFNRLFIRFGIRGGVKRVKLATLLYRRQLWLEKNQGQEVLVNESSTSSAELPKDSRTEKSLTPSEPLSM